MAVIESCVGVGFCRKTQTCLFCRVAVGADLVEHCRVIVGFAHHCHALAVLGRGAEHGGTAYVDVLDCVGKCDVGFGDSCLERIEVHAHEVDETDAVLGKLFHVAFKVAASQKGTVHLGVERLYASAADFGKTCDLAYAGHFKTAVEKHLHGASGGDDLPSHFLEGTGEIDHTPLIAYAY